MEKSVNKNDFIRLHSYKYAAFVEIVFIFLCINLNQYLFYLRTGGTSIVTSLSGKAQHG